MVHGDCWYVEPCVKTAEESAGGWYVEPCVKTAEESAGEQGLSQDKSRRQIKDFFVIFEFAAELLFCRLTMFPCAGL
ncbi:MAG: hypothetical protein B5M56_08500 [Desulfococcus sp. 4484_241]|nr:MAG: hypothetical protein B5M56_08500 [Desulfococcus sp. 4484_241]